MLRGAELAARFSSEVVEPLLARRAPRLPISTARLGSGSDVLGLDDDMSRDHDWGLRLTVVVPPDAVDRVAAALEQDLPQQALGLPVRFATTWDAATRHRVEVRSAAALREERTGIGGTGPLALLDHVATTGQAVLELTAGPVLRDDDGVLARLRTGLRWPEDVRRWTIASAWRRIEEELPFVGRTGERGDDVGSAVIAARIVRTTMQLALALDDRRAPYAKWLGMAFAGTPASDGLLEPLGRAVERGWRGAQDALVVALEGLAAAQTARGLPSCLPATEPFWDRPYRGLRPVAEAVRRSIGDGVVRDLPLIGPPDLWSDDVRVLVDHDRRRRATVAMLGLER